MTCIFCDVSPKKGFNIVYEDDDFVAFTDIAPAAVHHIQVVPKLHIKSVRSLNKTDISLLHSLRGIGEKLLEERNVEIHKRKIGFHIPPFNSVDHLHLHVQALPYSPRFKRWFYPINEGYGSNRKGFSWFVDIGQAIGILENGRKIGILPC